MGTGQVFFKEWLPPRLVEAHSKTPFILNWFKVYFTFYTWPSSTPINDTPVIAATMLMIVCI